MKVYTVLGIFNERDDIEQATYHLRDDGFDAKNISLIIKNSELGETASLTGTNVAGGILYALMGFGLFEKEAKVYNERIDAGGILFAVPATEDNILEAEEILEEFGAEEIKSVALPTDTLHINDVKEELDDNHHTHLHEVHEADAPIYAYGAKGGRSQKRVVW